MIKAATGCRCFHSDSKQSNNERVTSWPKNTFLEKTADYSGFQCDGKQTFIQLECSLSIMHNTEIIKRFHFSGTTQSQFCQCSVFDEILLMQRIHNERLHAYSLARKKLKCVFTFFFYPLFIILF